MQVDFEISNLDTIKRQAELQFFDCQEGGRIWFLYLAVRREVEYGSSTWLSGGR
jgi:hypothetical protein